MDRFKVNVLSLTDQVSPIQYVPKIRLFYGTFKILFKMKSWVVYFVLIESNLGNTKMLLFLIMPFSFSFAPYKLNQ